MEPGSHHHISYLISVWVEDSAEHFPLWQGVLVTAAGQRLPFTTLAQLNSWLCELGWQDAPNSSVEGAEKS